MSTPTPFPAVSTRPVPHAAALPAGVRSIQQTAPSIEQGYFVLTMMPSLYCALDCPHCYLSKAERRNPLRLADADLRRILTGVDAYYERRGIRDKVVHAYQYGGEPTSMGVEAFGTMLDSIDAVLSPERGYTVRHTVLSSLIEVDLDAWLPIFRDRCGNFLQSSYDGRMRGGAYMRTWDAQMRRARDLGLDLSTISVVNARLIEEGPERVLDYLSELGVVEASFLPFMWNEQNDGKKYDRLAPTMRVWSDFMIAMGEAWIARRSRGLDAPEIGQLRFVLGQAEMSSPVSNIAGQTLFLLPNGDFALPDYRNGWQEYMNRFANGLTTDFESVLASPKRRAYLRRQMTRNGNADCRTCPHGDKCVMEFWKDNRTDDECFGGRGFVEWALANRARIDALDAGRRRSFSFY